MKYFAITIIVLVAVAVVAGLFVVGSPKEVRLRLDDERRVQDLQVIQSEVVNYWMRKGALPDGLAALQDDIRGFVSPRDPASDTAYVYTIIGPDAFSLCANFNRASIGPPPGPYYQQQNWQHSDGQTCFQRKIDQDFYPSEKPLPVKR